MNKIFRTDSFSPYPVFVDTGTTLIDKSNMDLYFSAEAASKLASEAMTVERVSFPGADGGVSASEVGPVRHQHYEY